MRTLLLGAAFLLAAPSALACPMADAAAYREAAAQVQQTEGAKAVLAVNGMQSGQCSGKVKAALDKVEGVNASAVDYQTGETVVSFDESKVSLEQLVATIAESGFEVKVQPKAT